MSKYEIIYRVIVEAEDNDEATIISDEVESQIAGIQFVKAVGADPYPEEVF